MDTTPATPTPPATPALAVTLASPAPTASTTPVALPATPAHPATSAPPASTSPPAPPASPATFITHPTPLGDVVLSIRADSLAGLWFAADQTHIPAWAAKSRRSDDPPTPVHIAATNWVDAYFAGDKPSFELPLHLEGSEFQQTVWALLLLIPYGKTVTYGELAREIAHLQQRERPPAAQAIGGAVGRNPISLIVPCHRVVGSSGKLTGYAGGLNRKRALLELEGIL